MSRSNAVVHVQTPSAGAEASIWIVSVPPGQSSTVFPPPGFLNSTTPFTIGFESHVAATHVPAAEVVARTEATLKPGGMPIRAR